MTRWLIMLALCAAGVAEARPGGGHSYSGGSHSSSSGGGSYHSSGGYSSSSSGDIEAKLIMFLVLLAIIVIVKAAEASRQDHTWNSVSAPDPAPQLDLGPITASDPEFSRAVFEDFAYQLYAAAQRARTDPAQLAKLAPYLAPGAAASLAGRGGPVAQVVVGALRIEQCDASPMPPRRRIGVRIESNLALATGTLATVEHWVFTRALGVHTKPPVKTHTWPCPNCGAPWSPSDAPRVCGHCGQDMEAGKFDWAVDYISVESETGVGQTLTGTVAEVGNDYPTIVDPAAATTLASLTTDDPGVAWDPLRARVAMIYTRLNEAWNAANLAPVRGLVTHSMLDYLCYWLDEYRRQGLSNRLENPGVTDIQLAKAVRDHYFDAITVRVFATGNDFTLDGRGAVVGGSRTDPRAYTEYWTFLRSSARRGPIVATPSCPNCGAPLAISDAGACTSCNAEIENGSFDWVLSKIEQDDVYSG